MLLELVKMELQLAQNHVKVAQKQLEHLELNEPTTPQKKGGGPFHRGQQVRVVETQHEATIVGFLGDGLVLLKTKPHYRAFKKHYKQLEVV
jgi:hypothetical protein